MVEKKEKVNLKNEIEELVSLYAKRKSKKNDLTNLYAERKKRKSDVASDFKVEEKKDTYNKRIKLREKIFRLSIGRDSSASFIAFIQSLTLVINYLLNVARATVDNENDYVRFIFSHAPARYFSTAVLPLKEFNVNYFLNVFEKHMQSNKSLTAKGWETLVTIQTFPSGYSKNNKKNIKQKSRKRNHYEHLGNLNDDSGGVGDVVKKYGRTFRNGVFQVLCPKLNSVVKNCCFVVSLLIGLSFLKDDEKCKKLKRAPHKGCDDLYTPMRFILFIKRPVFPAVL